MGVLLCWSVLLFLATLGFGHTFLLCFNLHRWCETDEERSALSEQGIIKTVRVGKRSPKNQSTQRAMEWKEIAPYGQVTFFWGFWESDRLWWWMFGECSPGHRFRSGRTLNQVTVKINDPLDLVSFKDSWNLLSLSKQECYPHAGMLMYSIAYMHIIDMQIAFPLMRRSHSLLWKECIDSLGRYCITVMCATDKLKTLPENQN